jgi:hypothetical protein
MQRKQAHEQYQDEVRDLNEKDKVEEEQDQITQQKQSRYDTFKEAGMELFDPEEPSFLTNVVRDDAELRKLIVYANLKDTVDEYCARFAESVPAFTTAMMDLHRLKQKEKATFNSAVKRVIDANTKQCLDMLKNYEKNKKTLLRTIRAVSSVERKTKLEDLRKENQVLYDQFMEIEMNLFEQLEEFTKEYETKLAEVSLGVNEKLHGL